MGKMAEREVRLIVKLNKILFSAIIWTYLTIFGNLFYVIVALVILEATINFWYSALVAIIMIPVVVAINIIVENIQRASKQRGEIR